MGRDGKPVPYGAITVSPTNSNLCTKKRYRAGQGRNNYTNFAHDLAARPAGKFQFVSALTKDDNRNDTPSCRGSLTLRGGFFLLPIDSISPIPYNKHVLRF